jgi:hypothetical protein
MALVPCDRCGRHVHDDTEQCPFCERRSPVVRKALYLVGGAVTTVVLAACYGTGWDDTGWGPDRDGDGYPEAFDCNDDDASINPDALEVCDDEVDNDCDEQIDLDDPDCGDTDG